MPSRLQREIDQRKPFVSRAEEAFLALQRAAGQHHQRLAAFLKAHGLTPSQYNGLRILRGAHPEPLSCTAIGERMVNPVPDVTRLMDRLETRDLVERRRDADDRRVVKVGITAQGLELLRRLDRPIEAWVDEQLSALTRSDLVHLIELLERAH